ncbi:MAG: EscJ/YscJ/HrcJ family type secretion inner rane ring protein [Rhizobacter sp.]|nr:EscJ/YscJ/HrcJ family type secretion inner rane ring protein [Rhizobacter sp.]
MEHAGASMRVRPNTCRQYAISLIRSLVSVVMSSLLVFMASGCAERTNTELYRNLPETEANRLVAFLDAHSIKAVKQAGREGIAVLVSAASLPLAARLSTDAGLPREQYKGFGTVFQKDGLVSSPLEERARMMFAISQQLESMLTQIDGVVEAKVSVVLPERRSGRYTELPSAAVMIKHLEALDTTLLAWKIHRMVASSVPGLVDAEARQISISFTAVDSGSVDVLSSTPGATPSLFPPAEGDADALASAWSWRRVLPLAALATFLIGVVLLWLRQSSSPIARRIATAFSNQR